MHYIDTHTHLYTEYYPSDFHETVQRALQANVQRMILPCVTSKNIPDMLSARKAYPEHLFLLTGLHPTDVRKESYTQELEILKQYLCDDRFIGIGEIGMDLYWHKETLAEQQDVFRTQLTWARDLQLPVSVHVRDAFAEAYEILKAFRHDKLRGVMHCFSGGMQEAKWAVEYGFHLGIGGVITFKNNKLEHIVKEIGIQHIVLETDAPFLAPAPFRGKRNESAYIPYIAEKLSKVFELPIEEVMRVTTENATMVFTSSPAFPKNVF